MHAIKLCFVSREYAHTKMGRTGGIGVFVKNYSYYLQKAHFEVTVFTFGPTSMRFLDDGVQIKQIKDLTAFNESLQFYLRKIKMPGYISIKLILAYINRLYRSAYFYFYTLKNKFDVIEFHDYGGDVPFYFGAIPKVIRCHGSARTLCQNMNYPKRRVDEYFEGLAFKNYNKHAIGVSNYTSVTTQIAFALKTLPTVIYNGINCFTTKAQLADYKTEIEPFSICYFGSVRERKGIDIACNVFNQIIERFPLATFKIIGNNNNNYWDKSAIKLLSEKALKSTDYQGAIPNTEIYNYLKKAHVVLFPSYGENFSLALLEAMSIGKIVVTSNIASFKEIIKDGVNGFLATDDAHYVTIVSNIFENVYNTDAMALEAHSTIKNKFDLDILLKQNIHFYQKLVAHDE